MQGDFGGYEVAVIIWVFRTKPLSRELYEADKQLILLLNYANEKDFEDRVMKLEHALNWKLFKLPPIPYLPATDHQYTLLL